MKISLLSRLAPYTVALAASVLIAVSVWPGFMSWDSLHALRQARFGIENNAHPVIMSYWWRLLDGIYPGPGPMLLFQNGLFLLAFAHLLALFQVRALPATVMVIGLAIVPPLLGPMLAVWKDIGMMACFLAAVAALMHADKRGGRISLAVALLFIFSATAYRYNAAIASLPLWFWWSWLVMRRVFLPRWQWLGRLAVLFVLVTIVNLTAAWFLNNYRIPQARTWTAIALFDLIGTSHFARENLIPAGLYEHHENFTMDDLDSIYFPEHLSKSKRRMPDNAGLKLLDGQVDNKSVEDAWSEAIVAHPLSYLRHRLYFSLTFLGIGRDEVFYPTHYGVDPNDLGVSFTPTALTRIAVGWVVWASRTPLSQPWIYYLLGIAVIAFLVLHRPTGWHAAAFTLTSGYLYLFGSLAVLPAADLRYHSWSLAAVIVGCVLAALTWRASKGTQDDRSPS